MDKETRKKLKEIYDNAPNRRALVYDILGEGVFVGIDKNKESPRLEEIMIQGGWETPTITEGVKLVRPNDRLLFRLEVIADTDYYVEIETDAEITAGVIQ